jgi:arylsulfatase A-like enzyme
MMTEIEKRDAVALPVTVPVAAPVAVPCATPLRPLDHVVLAVWFGVVTGLVEVGIVVFRQHMLGILPSIPMPHALWMAPVAATAVCLAIGIPLALASWRRPRATWMPLAVFAYVAFLAFSVLLYVKGLAHYAALLLAVGIGVQSARWVRRRPGRLWTLVRLGRKSRRCSAAGETTPTSPAGGGPPADADPLSRRQVLVGTCATVAGLAAGVHGWRWFDERRALASLPAPTSAANRTPPNVLLVVWDTVRAASTSLLGYSRTTTPVLAQLARRGVSFQHAFAAASWSLPSHASMFTGQPMHRHGADWDTALDGTYRTLAEALRDRGYQTAGFVANKSYCSRVHGLDRGFLHYEDFELTLGDIAACSLAVRTAARSPRLRSLLGNDEHLGRKPASRVTDAFLDWLPQEPQRPFFAFLNYFDAHDPYLPPTQFERKFGPGRRQAKISLVHHWLRSAPMPLSDQDVQEDVDAYDGAIAYADDELSRLLGELSRRQLLDNTLVIVTSDHGEEFREHRVFGHGNTLYLPSLHVPLVVALGRRLPAGRNVDAPVSLCDLPATVLDFVEGPSPGEMPGRSLARYWTNGADRSDHADALLSELNFARNVPGWFPVAKGDMKSVLWRQFHFIRNGDGREELYDYRADPWEQQNLVATKAAADTLRAVRDHLARELA